MEQSGISKRLLTSAFLIFFIAIAVCSYTLTGIAALFFILAALYEFFTMIEKKGVRLFKIVGLLIGAFIPITIYFKLSIGESWQFLFVITGLFILFLLELTRREQYQVVLSISATIFGVLYISWCFSFIIRIRQLPGGAGLLAFLLLVTKSSDVGAYFTGKYFGKTPLIKRVSPKKSLEGATGGFLAVVLTGVLLSFLFKGFSSAQTFGLIIILAILSQLGDLFESLIKRDCGVKDSSGFLPGMGGVLDVIDSVIFTAPVFYLFITMVRR